MMEMVVKHAPAAATLFFFITFVGIAVWAYWPKNKQRIEVQALLPFKED